MVMPFCLFSVIINPRSTHYCRVGALRRHLLSGFLADQILSPQMTGSGSSKERSGSVNICHLSRVFKAQTPRYEDHMISIAYTGMQLARYVSFSLICFSMKSVGFQQDTPLLPPQGDLSYHQLHELPPLGCFYPMSIFFCSVWTFYMMQ
jgi:hypothetical protein